MEHSSGTVPRSLIVVLRVHLGVILLISVAGKLTRDAPFVQEMVAVLHAFRSTGPAYRAFRDAIVFPHAQVFSHLVLAGELCAGVSLFTGTLTRAGAAVAMFLFLNDMLAKGRMFWSPDSEEAAVFLEALVVCLGAAGRVLGMDALLARRWRTSLLF